MISWVEIKQADIFDPAETRTGLNRLANGLHVVTQRKIVSRELLFQPGTAYDSAQFAETSRNLRALGIFRFVSVDTVSTDSGLVARVVVKDAWTTRPDVGFRSTGDQVSYSLELLEDNLLGTATTANIIHRRDPGRNSTSFFIRNNRLIARTISVGLGYAPGSDGYSWNLSLASPFRSLSTRLGASLDLTYLDRKSPRFRDGSIVDDSTRRRLFEMKATAGWSLRASTAGFFRLSFTGLLRRDRIQETLDQLAPARTSVSVGSALSWVRARFGVMRGFKSMQRVEDIDVSTSLTVGAMLALKAWGQPRDGIAPAAAAQTGMVIGNGFLVATARASGLMTAAGVDSGSVSASATFAFRPKGRQLVIVHADGALLFNPVPGYEFDLGHLSGPRGFPSHAFTGDRRVFLTGEYRWTVSPSLFNAVALGLAGFVDEGGAWFAGSRVRLGTSLGVGLRLDSPREAKGDLFRIDLARTLPSGTTAGRWTLVLGKGFVF